MRILHASKPDRAFQRQFTDAGGDGGVVGRDAFGIERAHLGAGVLDALFQAAQGSGLQVASLQLHLFGGQRVAGAAVGSGPVQAEADGEDDDRGQQHDKSGVVPGKRGGQALAPQRWDAAAAHRWPPGF